MDNVSLEDRHLGVVTPVTHHEDIEAQLVALEPGQRLWRNPRWSSGQQNDLQTGIEQIEQSRLFGNDRVITTGFKEGIPVSSATLNVVLAASGIREHAVNVEDDRFRWWYEPSVPVP
jgi:hypothetical protein